MMEECGSLMRARNSSKCEKTSRFGIIFLCVLFQSPIVDVQQLRSSHDASQSSLVQDFHTLDSDLRKEPLANMQHTF
eukprot:6340095-Amphidinium_carterae.1